MRGADPVSGLIRNDTASVTLLSGAMAFVVSLLALLSVHVGHSVQKRMVTQNAVDSAADAAALWQARGVNMIQHLNDQHYTLFGKIRTANRLRRSLCQCSAEVIHLQLYRQTRAYR